MIGAFLKMWNVVDHLKSAQNFKQMLKCKSIFKIMFMHDTNNNGRVNNLLI